MILLIDTHNTVSFAFADPVTKKTSKIQVSRAEKLLKQIARFAKGKNIKMRNLKAIIINRGPGSYTGTRLGIAVANALGLAYSIPVLGFKAATLEKMINRCYNLSIPNKKLFATPIYSKKPNITISKK